MFHRITLIGFVGQAPQMRYTEEGTPVTNFSVATRQVVSKERVGASWGWRCSRVPLRLWCLGFERGCRCFWGGPNRPFSPPSRWRCS